ncbi:hypothetical protein KUW19_02690 [Ferrimonas balearica]|uniref:hypothetical protein n=1 Tax=Ferrimonas balearica TaxID=44012 RepID=UPI001C95BA67|nr:hypothetical protein [Ferrimonas balearica]MBY6105391.1 hypothetical protein [Ferrimonas balearica]
MSSLVLYFLTMLTVGESVSRDIFDYGIFVDGEQKASYRIHRSDSDRCVIEGTLTSSGLLFDGVIRLSSQSQCIDGQGWRLKQYRESTEVLWQDVIISQIWVNADHIEYYTGRHSENQRVYFPEEQRGTNTVDSLSIFYAVQDKVRRGVKSWQMSFVMPGDKAQPPVVERHRFSIGCASVEPGRSVENLVCVQSSEGEAKRYYWFDPAQDWAFVGSLRGDRLIWQSASQR